MKVYIRVQRLEANEYENTTYVRNSIRAIRKLCKKLLATDPSASAVSASVPLYRNHAPTDVCEFRRI